MITLRLYIYFCFFLNTTFSCIIKSPHLSIRYEAVLATCKKINRFILTEPIVYERTGTKIQGKSPSSSPQSRPSKMPMNRNLSKFQLFGSDSSSTTTQNRKAAHKTQQSTSSTENKYKKTKKPKLPAWLEGNEEEEEEDRVKNTSSSSSHMGGKKPSRVLEQLDEYELDSEPEVVDNEGYDELDEYESEYDRDQINKFPYTFHQDVLRSMNLQLSLVEALNIDYNLSFKGSICSSEEKIKSRNYLIKVQTKLVECLCLFVKNNPRNQRIIFQHLKVDKGKN
jgi:hypothetical protein